MVKNPPIATRRSGTMRRNAVTAQAERRKAEGRSWHRHCGFVNAGWRAVPYRRRNRAPLGCQWILFRTRSDYLRPQLDPCAVHPDTRFPGCDRRTARAAGSGNRLPDASDVDRYDVVASGDGNAAVTLKENDHERHDLPEDSAGLIRHQDHWRS
jgi:hypothetical protein